MVTEDPDGLRIKYYTIETRGPEIPITHDERWLGSMSADDPAPITPPNLTGA